MRISTWDEGAQAHSQGEFALAFAGFWRTIGSDARAIATNLCLEQVSKLVRNAEAGLEYAARRLHGQAI